jgi:hypothetical protein
VRGTKAIIIKELKSRQGAGRDEEKILAVARRRKEL